MERVAAELQMWIEGEIVDLKQRIHLFCGVGNNGADGLALARLLQEDGYNLQVYVVNFSEKRSKDFLYYLERLKKENHWPEFLGKDSDLPTLAPDDIVVDAIFGIGLDRAPAPWVGRLIEHINRTLATTISVDIPSGLPMDRAPWNPDQVVLAQLVLTVQWPKLVFFLPSTGIYVRHWEIMDVDMEPEYAQLEEGDFELIGTPEALAMYRPRFKFSHKGDYGHALIIGGSHGKIGAVQLAASAALSTGCGTVTAHVPECGYHSLQTAIPDVMVLTDAEERLVTGINLPFDPAAIGIGMGMGTDPRTVEAFRALLKVVEKPMVVDADGLNILAAHPELIADLPPNSILTPHPKELERLIGPWRDDFEKLDRAKAFATKHGLVLLIKGAHTITLSKDGGFVNTSGNAGMATAGSGDVLAGMLTALLAQGYPSLKAAILGTYLHGLAGDKAVLDHAFEGVRAPMIVENLGAAFIQMIMPSEMDEWQRFIDEDDEDDDDDWGLEEGDDMGDDRTF